MPSLCLGTAQFGMNYGISNTIGQVSPTEVWKILSVAKISGVHLIDTAISYGESEKVLGEAGLGGFRVVTKLPALPLGSVDVLQWVKDKVTGSLARLQRDSLYGLLLHHPQDLLSANSKFLIHALTDLKDRGLVQKVGVSVYSPCELDEIHNFFKFDLVQVPINVIDRRMETSGWLSRLEADGVEIHSRSSFLQGLLLMERGSIPEKFSRWSNLWDQWHRMLEVSGASPLMACLDYPLSLEAVNNVIVGVNNAAQFHAIFRATKENTARLDTSFMQSGDLDLINPSRWGTL